MSRLFPAYWAALALTIATLATGQPFQGAPSWSNIAANATMLQGWFGKGNIDPGYGSLVHEWMFYSLVAATFTLISRNARALFGFASLRLGVSVAAGIGVAADLGPLLHVGVEHPVQRLLRRRVAANRSMRAANP